MLHVSCDGNTQSRHMVLDNSIFAPCETFVHDGTFIKRKKKHFIYMMHEKCRQCFINEIYLLSPDLNECVNETHDCHKKSTCTNIDGSFTCSCNPGYFGNGTYCQGKCYIANIV